MRVEWFWITAASIISRQIYGRAKIDLLYLIGAIQVELQRARTRQPILYPECPLRVLDIGHIEAADHTVLLHPFSQ